MIFDVDSLTTDLIDPTAASFSDRLQIAGPPRSMEEWRSE